MLTPEECEIRIKKRKSVTNHLGTVHAIAMCNGCELAFGMVMESGLPSSLRWIPKGMTVRYLKKADSDLVVKCSFPEVKNLIAGDHQVPVQIFNNHQEVVMDAMITVYVSERKKN